MSYPQIKELVENACQNILEAEISKHLEAEAEETLAVLSLPEGHRPRLATTNCLERLNQSIKQRTRVVRIFPNRESCYKSW